MSKPDEKRLKVLLIFPPTIMSKVGNIKTCVPPLGISCLGAVAREAGHQVSLLDTIVEGYDSIESLNEKYVVFGLPAEQISERIRSLRPDVVGVSCLFSNQLPMTEKICRMAKEYDESVVTVVGGSHPTFLAKKCLQAEESIDCIVQGEGEQTFVELLSRIANKQGLSGLHGVAYRHDGRIVVNESREQLKSLDSLPSPAFDLLPTEKYFQAGVSHDVTAIQRRRSLNLMTSRGCPGKCVFCSSHKFWGNRYRSYSSERTLEEIERLIREYRVDHIEFTDDNFTLDGRRLRRILEGMIERKLNITWSTPNGVSLNTLNEEILVLMKASGCTRLTLAIESGDQEFLNSYIRKRLDLDRTISLARIMRRLGIEYNAFFIVGFPGETREMIKKTFRYVRKIKPQFGFFFLASPLPGTDLYEKTSREGLLNRDFSLEFSDFGRANYRTDEFSAEELEELYYKEYTGYLLRELLSHPFRFLPYLLGDNGLAIEALRVIKTGLSYHLAAPKKALKHLLHIEKGLTKPNLETDRDK